jgi:ABC-2 type transport system permease protein
MPAFFLILLYAAILMLGQQMLNITVEEKENRVTEMILTTIRPRVLILAKITAVIVAGLVQAAVFLVPALIWLGTTGGQLATSESSTPLGLSEIVVDPGSLALSALLFVGGFGMFTALLVVIGSVAPTVKDASSAFGGLVLAMFIPLYVTPLVASEPDSLITQVVTYFPLTAPIATQMRNATGTLSVPEGLAALVIVYATTGVLLWAAVRLFGAGSISYDTRLRLSALRRPRAAA